MTVPTPTKSYLDLTAAPFTANGSPAESSSLHARSDTFDFDKVNDWLNSSEAVNANGANKISFSGWLNRKNIAGGNSILNTRPTLGTGNYFYFNTNASNQFQFVAQNATSFTQSLSSSAIPGFKRTHICGTMDLSAVDINLFVDGVEMSYSIQNGTGGGGVATLTNGVLGVSSDFNNSFSGGLLGIIDRLKFWDGIILTPAEVLEEYNNEVAAQVGFTECEDHLYLCADAASPAVDSVGGAGFALTGVSSPTFNGPGAGTITLHRSSVDRLTTTSSLIDSSGYFSGYFKGSLPIVIAALNRLLSHTTNTGPAVDIYASGNLFIDVYSQVSAGFARAIINTGVTPASVSPSTVWGIAFAYNNATKTMIARVKSSTGINVAASSIGTVNPVYAAGTYKVGCSAIDASGTDIVLDQFGVKNGVAYTDAQLLAALESLVPAAVGGDLARAIMLLGAGPARTR